MKAKKVFLVFFVLPVLLFAYSPSHFYQNFSDGTGVYGSAGTTGDNETGVLGNIGSLKSQNFLYYDYSIVNNPSVSIPLNFAFQWNAKNNAFFGSAVSSVLSGTGFDGIDMTELQLGFSGMFHAFYWGGKVRYYLLDNSVFNSSGRGIGVSLGFIKIMDKVRFGINYRSPVNIQWTKNSDLILFNYISPVFNLGWAYNFYQNADFFLNVSYVFPLYRNSGADVSRNVLLYRNEINLNAGVEYVYKIKFLTLANSIGLGFFPDNKMGTMEQGDWKLGISSGLNIAYKNFPAVLKMAYKQDFIASGIRVIKFGILYKF